MPGPGASFFSTLFSGASSPTVPRLPSITLPQQQGQAIAANTASLPASETMASGANLFNEQQIQSMLKLEFPNMASATGNISSNIASETAGQLPADVSQAVWDSGAAKALGLGVGGSGAGADLVAKDLGLTSLQLTEQGLSDAEGWMKTSASLFEPSMVTAQSMFISPEQQYQATNQQNEQQWNVKWLGNQIAAQGNPLMGALGGLLGSAGDAAASFFTGGLASGALGGGGGGGDTSAYDAAYGGIGLGGGGGGLDPGNEMMAGGGGGAWDPAGEMAF
jgi:hypothetical protein